MSFAVCIYFHFLLLYCRHTKCFVKWTIYFQLKTTERGRYGWDEERKWTLWCGIFFFFVPQKVYKGWCRGVKDWWEMKHKRRHLTNNRCCLSAKTGREKDSFFSGWCQWKWKLEVFTHQFNGVSFVLPGSGVKMYFTPSSSVLDKDLKWFVPLKWVLTWDLWSSWKWGGWAGKLFAFKAKIWAKIFVNICPRSLLPL